MKYIYIDESGDLGENGSKYLIIAALVVDDPAPLERVVKKARRARKFKRELHKRSEIKGYTASRELVLWIINHLNKIEGLQVHYSILRKDKLYSDYLKTRKDKLYNYVAGHLCPLIAQLETHIDLRIDRSKGRSLQEDFNQYLRRKIENRTSLCDLNFHHSYSHSWPGLQMADIVVWCLFQELERNDSSYIDACTFNKESRKVF